MKNHKIHTDGSCLKNPGGAGGWAFVHSCEDILFHERGGSSWSTTSNRMELHAAIEACRYADREKLRGSDLTICSDSKYVIKGITSWSAKWERNSWLRKQNGGWVEVANADLWKRLRREVLRLPGLSWQWVRGHNGDLMNERADALALSFARGESIEFEPAYLPLSRAEELISELVSCLEREIAAAGEEPLSEKGLHKHLECKSLIKEARDYLGKENER